MAGVFDLITSQLDDAEAQWSLGTFGAIAEFSRDADEPAEIVQDERSASVVTPRGGIRIELRDDLKPLAFETVTTQAWSQRIAFCLPENVGAMGKRTVLTELGPDARALRPQDSDAIVFDLGLGAHQTDCCVRTSSAELIEGLRACAGRSLLASGNPAMALILRHSPHRVFVTRAGRAEIYQNIPSAGGKAPDGPHTHVLPKLLAHKRTHAATEPIPRGFVSCAHLYPAHPLRDGYGRALPFDAARYSAFQRLLSRHGDIEHVRMKRNVVKAISAGAAPNAIAMPSDRFVQASVRIALRQIKASEGTSPALAAWFAAHDNVASDPDDEEVA